jgi:hypothetical protein
MSTSALRWGRLHGSCQEAIEWRRSLGKNATQADAWRKCHRGDWLFWQLSKLPRDERVEAKLIAQQALARIVARAIRRARKYLRGVREPLATQWQTWAQQWSSGEDRTGKTAWAIETAMTAPRRAARVSGWASGWAEAAAWAAEAAAKAAEWDGVTGWAEAQDAAEAAAWVASWTANAWEAELRLQARDLRREQPKWPGMTNDLSGRWKGASHD